MAEGDQVRNGSSDFGRDGARGRASQVRLDAGKLGVAKPAPRSRRSCTDGEDMRNKTAVNTDNWTESGIGKEKRLGRTRT
jgi:hypothetical protein